MFSKLSGVYLTLAVCLVFFSTSSLASGETETDMVETAMEKVEDSTESPIADMAMIESEMKTSTERPPPMMEAPKEEAEKPNSQRHTVADFIIHPLIAFKPRKTPDEQENKEVGGEGKQAGGSSTTTTPSPWQLFGFNAGQGLGSSVTSLAGSVTGWLNDRIQLPGLVETPVRESTTTTSTTTTTPRPDIVVKVQHKPSTRRPLISIADNVNRPNRPNRRNKPNFVDSAESNDDEDDDEFDYSDENKDYESNEAGDSDNDNEGSYEEGEEENDAGADNNNNSNDSNEAEEDNENYEGDEDEEDNEDVGDDDDTENYSQRPNNKRRPLRKNPVNVVNTNNNNNNVRRGNRPQNTRRRVPNQTNQRQRPATPNRRRLTQAEHMLNDIDYEDDDVFYYGQRPSMKRSQSSPNFIQRGQQHLLNQFRQLTRGQSPGEIGAIIKNSNANYANMRRQPQQATLYVNRNGQTVYMAPELAQFDLSQQQQQYPSQYQQQQQSVQQQKVQGYPQPPLTVPITKNGQTIQYITIPWSQLGISPPSNLASITEGVQSTPYILNIPQSAINAMQNQAKQGKPKKKQPQLITAEAVPLLADASLMDIFKPPKIPNSRASTKRPATSSSSSSSSMKPIVVAKKPSSTKKNKTTPFIQKRVRPMTLIEMAPNGGVDGQRKTEQPESNLSTDEVKIDAQRQLAAGAEDEQYIIVGDDNEPGILRQVQPVYGEARYVQFNGHPQYYDTIPSSRRRFTVTRTGRELTTESKDEMSRPQQKEATSETMMVMSPSEMTPPAAVMIHDDPVMESTVKMTEPAAPAAAAPATPQIEKTQLTPELKTT